MSHVQPRQQRQPRFTVQDVLFEKIRKTIAGKAKNIKKRAENAAGQIKEAVKKAAEKAKKAKKSNKPKGFMSEKLFVPPSGC